MGLGAAVLLSGQGQAGDWKALLEQRLPEFGHRNWIVIADAAYPKQSAQGIETISTGAGQIEVLQRVLGLIGAADHIRPVILLDAELESVPEGDAPGVDDYRAALKKLLGKRPVKAMPHDDIIGRLDKASKLFNILILKTDMTIPYTSVFVELDCGYWDAEREKKLRDAIEKNTPTER